MILPCPRSISCIMPECAQDVMVETISSSSSSQVPHQEWGAGCGWMRTVMRWGASRMRMVGRRQRCGGYKVSVMCRVSGMYHVMHCPFRLPRVMLGKAVMYIGPARNGVNGQSPVHRAAALLHAW